MKNSPSLAAVLIVKNESEQLAQCLTSIENFVDEIVILDGGSDDNTLEIASRFTEKTYIDTTWEGFGRQRQKAQTYVDSDWIFWVDADERFTPELGAEIKEVIATASTQNVCLFHVYLGCLGIVFGIVVGIQTEYCAFISNTVDALQ